MISQIMELYHLTNADVAAVCGVSKGTVQSWVKNGYAPTHQVDRLQNWCDKRLPDPYKMPCTSCSRRDGSCNDWKVCDRCVKWFRRYWAHVREIAERMKRDGM